MPMNSNVLKIIALIAVLQTIVTSSQVKLKAESETVEDAYLGWPHVIQWPRSSKWRSIKVLNASNILYNETASGEKRREGFRLPDVTEDTPKEYVIFYTNRRTMEEETRKVKLNVIPFLNETCEETLKRNIHTEFDTYLNGKKVMDCSARKDVGLPAVHVEEKNKTCTWYRNCKELNETDFLNIKRDSSCELTFTSVKKEQYGTYTCSINNNGMKRIPIHYNLCYKPTRTLNKKPILCPTEPIKAKIGESKTISVKSILGTGEHNSLDMGFTWKRLNDAGDNYTDWDCWSFHPGETDNATIDWEPTEDVCHVTDLTKKHPKCTTDIDSIKPDETLPTVLRANLTIKRVKKSDFGTFQLISGAQWDTDEPSCNITLVEDKEEHRKILLFSLIAMTTVLFVLAIAYCMRRSIRILYRRHFAKIEDSCKIYLSYQYSTSMDEDTKEITKQAVTYVEGILTKLGCSVFDENRDGNISSYESENVHVVLESCQLVFIFLLSPHYISDGWSVFKLQKCFERSVVTKSRLVFIITPQMIKYVKEKSNADDFCSLVKNAMKMNHVVTLADKFKKSNSIPFEIELAVPRLRTAKKGFKHEALVHETRHL